MIVINQEISNLGGQCFDFNSTFDFESGKSLKDLYEVTKADVADYLKLEAEAQSKGASDGIGFASALGRAKDFKTASTNKENQSTDASPQKAEDKDPDESKRALVIKSYEIKRIWDQVEDMVNVFDNEILTAFQERVILERDLKSAEIKLLLLYEEYMILKEFEKLDGALKTKLDSKKQEKSDIDTKITDCAYKLTLKKAEIEAILEKQKELNESFCELIGENNKNEEYVTKVFKRKIKRQRKKYPGEASDESDSFEFSDEEIEEEKFDEICPADYDESDWQKVLELRHQRLDQEEALGEIQKSLDILRKENESLLKKEKTTSNILKSTEVEIQEFQTQKQRKLNEIDVAIPLRFSQIQYLENDSIPSDLSKALVFEETGVNRLNERIKQLNEEKLDIKKQHRDLKKQHVQLFKSKREKREKFEELESKDSDLQMLKFGRKIDLEKLEKFGVNRVAEEMKDKIHKEDLKRQKEILAFNQQISKIQSDLTYLTKENTIKLERIIDLKEENLKFETYLNNAQSNAVLSSYQEF
jgi:hypothetical protein